MLSKNSVNEPVHSLWRAFVRGRNRNHDTLIVVDRTDWLLGAYERLAGRGITPRITIPEGLLAGDAYVVQAKAPSHIPEMSIWSIQIHGQCHYEIEVKGV